MKKLGLIGFNISYSISPKLHSLIKKETNINFTYEIIDIKENNLSTYINKLKEGIYHGYNITTPYKEEIIKYLDVLTPAANYIKSVNTVYLEDGKIVGDNTDYLGFKYLLDKIDNFNKKSVCFILGSGGAAKACAYVLDQKEMKYSIVSRNRKEDFYNNIISYDDFYKNKHIDLLINATPLGNINNPVSPIKNVGLKINTIIDLTYNPLKTKLMELSNNSFNGLDMLITQAIYSQKRWFKNIAIKDETIKEIKGALENELVREII